MVTLGYWASRVFRIGYGLFFFVVGAYGCYSYLSGGGNPFDVSPGAGADFQAALDATGFVVPIMLICYIVGGSAMWFRKTAPLGVVILAPFVVVIFFYHVLLGGSTSWASFWAIGLAVLAYDLRSSLGALIGLPK